MPEFPVPIEQLIEFNGVRLVLTTRRSFEQVRYKECDVALSVYGDEILVLTAGRVPVFMGDRTRQAPPLALGDHPVLGHDVGGMEQIIHFLGVTILLVTAARLQILRQFFAFCLERQWLDLQPGIENNPAKRIKLPKNIKPAAVVPYTAIELAKIRGACDMIGRSPYERLRARAMVLILRYTGLRISDVATLDRDRIKDGRSCYTH